MSSSTANCRTADCDCFGFCAAKRLPPQPSLDTWRIRQSWTRGHRGTAGLEAKVETEERETGKAKTEADTLPR
ncbi:hypothetical protein N7447_010728 [Penicillium robsamsonii]|uniref:uncharacterized protein n=1 Tax=Penicillium robsamsonii TaxID=1792511 RepID=UPI00254849AB|nr:uncharacterized protein N7447_010728 [Penicillium robsamsonii]KAJ5811212.1 hypothetical protein N7447_010728 [Penicillium robsamsonii]